MIQIKHNPLFYQRLMAAGAQGGGPFLNVVVVVVEDLGPVGISFPEGELRKGKSDLIGCESRSFLTASSLSRSFLWVSSHSCSALLSFSVGLRAIVGCDQPKKVHGRGTLFLIEEKIKKEKKGEKGKRRDAQEWSRKRRRRRRRRRRDAWVLWYPRQTNQRRTRRHSTLGA